ncbi:hypothetical protein FB446DRAFT_794220 [Lentinula raphanica]|nr:hypothetical protein FB446DRAFT_794220 [Lentinula raphanica]
MLSTPTQLSTFLGYFKKELARLIVFPRLLCSTLLRVPSTMMENPDDSSHQCDMQYPTPRDSRPTASLDPGNECARCLYNVVLMCQHQLSLPVQSQALHGENGHHPEGKSEGCNSYRVDNLNVAQLSDPGDLVTTWAGLDLGLGDESLFYVMLIFTFLHSEPRREIPKPVDERIRYEQWHQLDDEALDYKQRHDIMFPTLDAAWSPPVTPFSVHFSDWLYEIHDCFCCGFTKQAGFMRAKRVAARRPDGKWRWRDKVQTFEDDTLGGHISYGVLVFIMHEFNGEKLLTHDREVQDPKLKPVSDWD